MTIPTNLASALPANPIPDPAAISGKLAAVSQSLQNFGIDKSISDALLAEVTQKVTNAGNTIASTVTGNYNDILNALKLKGIDFQPVPNVLDEYASYTYHLKLCMVSDTHAQAVSDYDTYATVSKEVIAESGVTAGFNIRDFEIKNYCAPQERIGISIETEWKMTLVEPYGLSFVDRLFTLSKNMGMTDHLKGIYFIEVWFQGINEEGDITGNEIYKLYRVIVKEINVDSLSSGSVYNITGVVDGTIGQSNEFAMTPAQISVDDVTTFAQFWSKFKTQLNQLNQKIDYDTSVKRAEYDFVMPKEWLSWTFTRDPKDNASQSGFTIKGPPNTPKITIPRGKSISEILIMVMSITAEGKKFTMGPSTAGKDSGNNSSRAESEGVSLVPIVQSKVEFLSYNYLFNDYTRKVTFYFSKYPTVRSYKNRDFINNSQKPEVQKQRLQSFVSEARLKKVYNYQFTGLNTDVIRFDIKLDNYWAAMQPLFDGYNNSTVWSLPQSVPGASVPQTIISDYKKARSNYEAAQVKLQDLQNVDKSQQVGKFQDTLKSLQNEVEKAKKVFETISSKINIQDFEIKFGNSSPGEKSIAGIIINNPQILTDPAILQNVASRIAYSITRGQAKDRYLETILPEDPRSNPLPISTFISNAPNAQNNVTGSIGLSEPLSTTNTAPPKSRGLLAAILDNVTGPQFVNIELEIRGDPYWMGIDNIQNLPYLNPDTPPPITLGKQSALFATGECGLLLFFRTGEEPNESSGLVEFNTSSWAFNGLYVVVEVDNYFKDGKFTQILHANKDCALFSVWDSLSAESKSK